TTRVTVDDMCGATPNQNQYKYNLERQHERLKQHGSALLKGFPFTCLVGRLRFMNSAHSELIQVADIAAYNVFRQFVDHGDDWERRGIRTLPTYEYFDRISSKFRCDAEGRIQGYGIAKFPIVQRVHWTVRQEKKSEAAP